MVDEGDPHQSRLSLAVDRAPLHARRSFVAVAVLRSKMSALRATLAMSTAPAAVRAPRASATRRAAPVAKAPAGMGGVATLPSRRASTAALRVAAKPAVRARHLTVRAADGESTVTERVSTDTVMIDPVVGAKRFSNYFWAGVVTTGATGFLITGASAYFQHNLLWFLDASEIKFFPQGLVMSFYGVAGSLLATYLWCVPPRPDPPPAVRLHPIKIRGRSVARVCFIHPRRSTTSPATYLKPVKPLLPVHPHRLTINWDVGSGYNEFNKEEGIMRIFRYGFPGKNRRINLVSNLADVQAVRVEISDGVNPRRVVYVRCKGKSDIPLTRIGQPLTLAEVEKQAADLAKFLGVPIEGL